MNFLEELWQSVFTPGPTPVLVAATNVTFAVTLPILLYLAATTGSLHYTLLSAICAGLWISINWFVRELRAVEEQQRQLKIVAAKLDAAENNDSSQQTGMDSIPGLTISRSAAAILPPDVMARSTNVEPLNVLGNLTPRGTLSSSRSNTSNDDEWVRLSDEEKFKDGEQ